MVAALSCESYRTRDIDVHIKARAPEKGNFTPNYITIPVGETVKMLIRNVDTVAHGFAIPELKVDAGEIKAGHNATVEVRAEEAGEYEFYCTVWCGEFHLQMRDMTETIE